MENQNGENNGPKATKLKCTTLAESTQNYFLNTELADVYFLFEIEQVRIPAHKMVLAMASSTFKSMFYGSIPEEGDIKIVDSSSEEFKEFLSTLYSGDVTITSEHVGKVMYLAEKYLVAGSLDVCDRFLLELQTIDDIIVGFDLAVQFNRTELKKKLEEKLEAEIADQPKAVVASDSLLKCSRDTLKHFLQNDGLMCCGKELFDVCMKWAENACESSESDPSDMENRKKELGELFHWIPFYFMDHKEIVQITADYRYLFDKDEWVDLISIIGSDGPVSMKKFKLKFTVNKSRVPRYRWMLYFRDEKRQWIGQHEDSFIKSKRKHVPYIVKFSFIFHKDVEQVLILSGIMSITKQGQENNILLKQRIEIECHHKSIFASHKIIKLVKPVDFEAGATYRFHIDFDSSWKEQTFFTYRMDGEPPDIIKFLNV